MSSSQPWLERRFRIGIDTYGYDQSVVIVKGNGSIRHRHGHGPSYEHIDEGGENGTMTMLTRAVGNKGAFSTLDLVSYVFGWPFPP